MLIIQLLVIIGRVKLCRTLYGSIDSDNVIYNTFVTEKQCVIFSTRSLRYDNELRQRFDICLLLTLLLPREIRNQKQCNHCLLLFSTMW